MSFKYIIVGNNLLGCNMNNLILGWEITEIRQLLDSISLSKTKSLNEIFESFACVRKRKVSSVKSFYYRLKNLSETDEKVKSLLDEYNINISSKYVTQSKQNENKGNIVIVPQKREVLSQSDIDSLFWGLVKLVKRNAESEVQLSVKRELELVNQSLGSTLISLKKKEVLLRSLKEQNDRLKKELANLKCKDTQLNESINYLEDLANDNQIQKLKVFLDSLKKREVKNEKM